MPRSVLPVLVVTLLAAAACGAQSIPGAILARREPHHHFAYEDSTVRVLRVRVGPKDTTLLHEHDPDYVWIALGASEIVNAKLGAPDAVIKSKNMSIHYTPGNFAHVARNRGRSPFDNITVELLQPQSNVRNLCEPALGGQPANCSDKKAREHEFIGAGDHPAFMTDQLKVSLATIAPGGTLRPASGNRTWLIAVDTLDTRKALALNGGGNWVGGVSSAEGKSWNVKNRSRTPKRVLTVTTLRGGSH
jgi:hypothetical protein